MLIVRKAYKLSDKVLTTTNIERTNVMLADSLFHKSTINALCYYGKKGNLSFLQNAELLSIFKRRFNKVNVKSQYEGQLTLDPNREWEENQSKVLDYLRSFHGWLKEWQQLGTSGLLKETFSAAKQTTSILRSLTNFLFLLDAGLPAKISGFFYEF